MKLLNCIIAVLIFTACGTAPKTIIPPVKEEVDYTHLYTPYTYKAKVTDVYDGDTYTLDFSIGFSLRFEDVIRLARVDTPELRGEERPQGLKVRDYVQDLILNKDVIVKTDEDDRGKYGRLLTEIYFEDTKCICYINLSDHLLAKKYAKEYK